MAANKPQHTIGIIGVRDYNGVVYENAEYIKSILDTHLKTHGTPEAFDIVTGGGRGVESLVLDWAQKRGAAARKIPPNINQFGAKKAFTIRNNNIVADADDLILFWDGYADVLVEAIVSAMHLQKRVTVYPLV